MCLSSNFAGGRPAGFGTNASPSTFFCCLIHWSLTLLVALVPLGYIKGAPRRRAGARTGDSTTAVVASDELGNSTSSQKLKALVSVTTACALDELESSTSSQKLEAVVNSDELGNLTSSRSLKVVVSVMTACALDELES